MPKLALSHYFKQAIKRVLPHHCPLCNGLQSPSKTVSSSLRYQRYSHGLNTQYKLITQTPLNADSRLLPLAQFVSKHETSHAYFCEQCFDSLPVIKQSCSVCDLPIVYNTAQQSYSYTHCQKVLCPECQSQPPAFDRVICAYEYNPLIASVITKFKQHGDVHCGTALTRGLIDRLWLEPNTIANRTMQIQASKATGANALEGQSIQRQSYIHSFDALVPVPIHWRTKLQRGFNQSEWIATAINRHSKSQMHKLLKKTALTGEQKKLNRKQRETNVKASIQIKPYKHIPKRIVLIDDVVTTGATANCIALELKNRGAERVDVWALARTPK